MDEPKALVPTINISIESPWALRIEAIENPNQNNQFSNFWSIIPFWNILFIHLNHYRRYFRIIIGNTPLEKEKK